MKKTVGSLLLPLCLLHSSFSHAQQLNSLTCVVTEKIFMDDTGKLQTYPKSYFEKYQPSVRIVDTGSSAIVQRCDRTDCTSYKVDHVARAAGVNITKFYYLAGQFDVQVFPSMDFIENNGRGSFGIGKCRQSK